MQNVTITKAHLTNYIPSTYTTPITITYNQNGTTKQTNLFTKRQGVLIIIYNTTRNKLLFVRQFRPAAFIHDVNLKSSLLNVLTDPIDLLHFNPSRSGTLELCAGTIDKSCSIKQIAVEEMAEECGYMVTEEALEEVCVFPEAVHPSGELHWLFYCEVNDSMKVEAAESDQIEVVEMSPEEAEKFCLENDGDMVTAPLLFGLFWFLSAKYGK